MKARVVVATGVLGAWGLGIALYAERELTRSPGEKLVEVALRVSPGASWFAVERNGSQVGFASITIDTVPRELHVTEYLVADTRGGGGPATGRLTEQTVVRLSRGLELLGYTGSRALGGDTTQVEGEVSADHALVHRSLVGARRDSSRVALSGGAHFPPQLVPILSVLGAPPRAGRESALNLVDPQTGSRRAAIVQIDAESLFVVADSAASTASGGVTRWIQVHTDTVRAWRLTSTAAGHPLDLWVDALGQVVEARRADGLLLRRTAFELAFENWRLANPSGGVAARANGRVVSATLLASGAARPDLELDTLRVRVRGSTPFVSNFVRQYRAGNVLTVARAPAKVLVPRYRFPTEARWRTGFAFNLRREPKVETDDPALASLALRLRGVDPDPARAIGRIMAWVRDSLQPDASSSRATAAEALARRRGDAREYARVVVALARAAGVPARSVSGLLLSHGRFYYHAWAEVYLGGWVSLDPMLSQIPADAAHLTMRYESLDAEEELLRLVGRLELTVVSSFPSASTR